MRGPERRLHGHLAASVLGTVCVLNESSDCMAPRPPPIAKPASKPTAATTIATGREVWCAIGTTLGCTVMTIESTDLISERL